MDYLKGRLPNKPSALITMALDDLNKVERMDGYVVNMGAWHQKFHDSTCNVCFAGAVISRSLKGARDSYLEPCMYDDDTKGKLYALDNFRQGICGEAFEGMGLPFSKGTPFERDIPEYHEERRKFKLAMRKLVRDLKASRL